MVENKSKKHVQVPTEEAPNKQETLDKFVYGLIKSYMSKYDKKAYPSIQTLSERSKLGKDAILASIKRLEKEGLIKVDRDGYNNIYTFTDYNKFEPFSEEFLDNEDLTSREKGYIIALQPYMFKDIYGIGKVSLNLSEIAYNLGISESTVRRYNNSLKSKNYMNKEGETLYFMLEKIGQAIIWKLKEHDEDIKDIKEYIKQNEKEKAEMNEIIKTLLKQNKDYERLEEIKQNKKKRNKFKMT